MRRTLRSHLTYANVMATIALFLALGGGVAWALTAPKNSVTSNSIKNGEVKEQDLAAAALRSEAAIAVADNPLTAQDPCATGQTGIFCGTLFTGSGTQGHWENAGGSFAPLSFYRDRAKTVHLSGVARLFPNATQARIFVLPEAYRPSATHEFTTSCWQASLDNYDNCLVSVNAGGEVSWKDGYFPAASDGGVSFDGLSFRVQ